MLFTSIILVLLVSIILLVNHWSQNKGIVYLVAIIFFLNLRQTTILLANSDGYETLVAILHIHFDPLIFLMGPFLLYYLKSQVQGKIVFDKYFLLHAVPALLAFVNTLPYYSYPFESKVAYISQAQEIYFFDPWHFPYLILPLKYQGIGLIIFNTSYALFCIAYIIGLRKNGPNYQKKKLSVLLQHTFAFILTTIANNFILMIFIVVNSPQIGDLSYRQLAFKGGGYLFFMALVLPLFFFLTPSWLYNEQQRLNVFDTIRLFLTRFKQPVAGSLVAPTNENLSDMERIITYIEKEKPYLQVNFSLHNISQVLNIPHIRISNAFNQQLNTSFPVYRNKLRLAHTISLIYDGAHLTNSIEGIAVLSGFKSMSIFYSAFREEHGMTPTEWIKKNL
ncbi:MAG: helix-turn-helix domain-containing protein [Algoriphagus sp.]|jgi:AraC-like DNA-binding protein|uniref:helix-turn-helix domain-containing protein n=1 Tax=Algoriphagus sp. TaxID=1872435 RepID=UPI002752E732|nr:helix-turn-helix domain-containing protein [Algoriphagus sp.]MDP4956152.1 helix-turn-helix domain-containing protein [Algoriphagus sp.]MDP5125751.1 helix-turn-helix domain-containing protein [Algoriphagus sp.]